MTFTVSLVEICLQFDSALAVVLDVPKMLPFGTKRFREAIDKSKGDELCQARFITVRQSASRRLSISGNFPGDAPKFKPVSGLKLVPNLNCSGILTGRHALAPAPRGCRDTLADATKPFLISPGSPPQKAGSQSGERWETYLPNAPTPDQIIRPFKQSGRATPPGPISPFSPSRAGARNHSWHSATVLLHIAHLPVRYLRLPRFISPGIRWTLDFSKSPTIRIGCAPVATARISGRRLLQ